MVFASGCISFPKIKDAPHFDPVRGACRIAYPDGDLCLLVTFENCVTLRGEYKGDGSVCNNGNADQPSILVEDGPSPLYLDKKIIYSVAGTATVIFAAWAANKKRRKRGNK